MSDPGDENSEDSKPEYVWGKSTVGFISSGNSFEGVEYKIAEPLSNPFETYGTIYSNGLCSPFYYGHSYKPLVTLNEERTQLTINLETLREVPMHIDTVIKLLYASLRS